MTSIRKDISSSSPSRNNLLYYSKVFNLKKIKKSDKTKYNDVNIGPIIRKKELNVWGFNSNPKQTLSII